MVSPVRQWPHPRARLREDCDMKRSDITELEDLLEDGRYEDAAAICEKQLRKSADDADLWAYYGEALAELQDLEASAKAYERAIGLDPDWDEGHAELGLLHLELGRFEEAERVLDAAMKRTGGKSSLVVRARGTLLECQDKELEAERAFALAERLDAEACPHPVRVSQAAFQRAVNESIAALPDDMRAALESNVRLELRELPDRSEVGPSGIVPSMLVLECFTGTSLPQRSSMDPWSQMPAHIFLYKKNLERYAVDREHLVEEIETTLLHELGHFLGLDEEEVAKRGLR